MAFEHNEGVACGVTACLGTPLGGVLYSIEITAKAYDIKFLWEGMIASSFCILVFAIITFLKRDSLFERTTLSGFSIGWELVTFAILGAIMGVSVPLRSY